MPPPPPPLPSLTTPTTHPTLQIYTSHPLHPLTPPLLRHLQQTLQTNPTLSSLIVSFTDSLLLPSKLLNTSGRVKSVSLLQNPGAVGSLNSIRLFWDAVRKEVKGREVVVLHGVDVLLELVQGYTPEEAVSEVLEVLALVGAGGKVVVVLEEGEGGRGIMEGLGGEAECFVGMGRRADGVLRIARGVRAGETVREGEWVVVPGEGRWGEVE